MKMITLEDVYPWLNRYDNSHIRPSSEYLINRLKTALAAGQTDKVRNYLQQLKNLARMLQDEKEVNEVLIECGRSAFRLGDLSDAENILEDAFSRIWSDLHRRAVVQWMLGCVQWAALKRQQAVRTWQNSQSDFERLTSQTGLSPEKHLWYQGIYWKLDQSLIEALGETCDASGPEMSTGGSETSVTKPEQATNASQAHVVPDPVVTMTSDILQLYTVSEEIPAGDFGPGGVDPFPVGKIEIDHLNIDGHPYRIYNPRGRRIVSLPSDQKITVVKVKGDSMNEENILPGDFVVLRPVDVPANGDIVMAVIFDVDSRATLKLFFKEKDTITLQPHSSNPLHKPFVFKKIGKGFDIRGVVIAVLKPI